MAKELSTYSLAADVKGHPFGVRSINCSACKDSIEFTDIISCLFANPRPKSFDEIKGTPSPGSNNILMPNKKQKKPKKPKLGTLRRKADQLWSERVRELHGHRCAICGMEHGKLNGNGSPVYLNAHHIEGRNNYATRFDILNGIALCPGHHDLKTDSAEQSPLWFMEWLKNNRPNLPAYILSRRNLEVETSVEWYQAILARFANPIVLTDEEKAIVNFPASYQKEPPAAPLLPTDEMPS